MTISQPDDEEDRQEFLATCVRLAVVTPPTTTFLFSTSLTSNAIAATTGYGQIATVRSTPTSSAANLGRHLRNFKAGDSPPVPSRSSTANLKTRAFKK
jgi:hypothetical protein